MRKAFLLSVFKLLLFIGVSTSAVAANNQEPVRDFPNQASPLGINTNEALEVDASLPFIDLFRFALPFEEARPWLTKGEVDYDDEGWPVKLHGDGYAGTRFLNNVPANALPGGTYTVLYEGEGRLQYGGSAKLVEASPGKDLIRLEPKKNNTTTATLYIRESNPENHVRNIRVLMSGGICARDPLSRVDGPAQCAGKSYQAFADHYDDIIFNPAYLNFMKDFKVIRFMNMSGITRNDLRYWQYRPELDDATWGGSEGLRGVPLEIMVKLANQLNLNPWFNMPHYAGDDYIRRAAEYIKQHLKPELNVYIEYTNEAWNAVFVPQAEHMKQKGTIAKLDTDRRIAGFKYYSKHSVHIFKLWEEVFGGTDRLVRVLGGMTTDPAMSETILAYQQAYQHVDALAIAPYFYIDEDKLQTIANVDDVFNLLAAKDNRYSIANLLKVIRQQAEIAQAYGVDLIAYEGGQHLVDHKTHKMTEGATPHLVAANRDPRMAEEYQRLLTGWKDVGGKLFVAFSAPRPPTWHGSWGIKEYINQPDDETPKYRALLAFMDDQPCWWQGCEDNQIQRLPKPEQVPEALVNGEKPVAGEPVSVVIKRDIRGPQQTETHRLGSLIKGTLGSAKDLSAVWQASWNERVFNLTVEVGDDQLKEDSDQAWADDSVEVYIDANASRQDKYDGEDDFQLVFRMKDKAVGLGGNSPKRDISTVQYEMSATDTGYRLELSVPWELLGVEPVVGLKMGFDVHVNDDDNGHLRDAKMSWNAAVDQAWKNPGLFGEIKLGN
ncbi:MAG: sugar-binding protein [Thiolinea sp.]